MHRRSTAREVELQRVLLQHLAAAMGTRRHRRTGRALQAHGTVAQRFECEQVASGPAADIKQIKRRWAGYVPEQPSNVLADILVTRVYLEALGVLLIARQSACGNLSQVLGTLRYANHAYDSALIRNTKRELGVA